MSELPLAEPEILEEEETSQELDIERLYRVLIHNDDVTPYDFVIIVLMRFFKLDSSAAEVVTWTAHSTGIALVTILPKVEAERRVGQAHFAASLEGYPLTLSVEPA